MNDKLYIPLSLVSLAIVIYALQSYIIFNADVASLLFDTELFLSGGTYVKDFFETNPPMIFILYAPIVIMQKITAWDSKLLTHLYIAFFSVISLSFCFAFIKKIIPDNSRSLTYAIIGILIYLFFIASVGDFGQREHLLVIFSMPYIFLVTARAKSIPVSFITAAVIGLMAGLVFSLKPFFLLPFVLLEGYLLVIKKSMWSWVRVETLIILGVMIVYLLYVINYHPLYFGMLMPLITKFYFKGTAESLVVILCRAKNVFCLGMVLFYLFLFPKNYLRELSQVLCLALIGFNLAFLVPRAGWGYHVYPAYGFALLLMVIYVYSICFDNTQVNNLRKKEVILMLIAAFGLPVFIYAKDIWLSVQVLQSSDHQKLYSKVKAMPYRSIYCFSLSTTGVCFPLVSMYDREFAGRFPMLWWVRGVRMMEKKYGDHMPLALMQGKHYLIDALAYDLDHYKPELIIVFNLEEEAFLPKGYDYPTYFSQRESFKAAWSHYILLENIGLFTFYRRV